MSYTTIANVAGMFPTFVRGTTQQKPADTLIQTYIDDVGGDIDAILQKRFGEIIASNYGGSFAAFQAAFSTDAQNVLEKINRIGAASQLGLTLSTFGVAAAERLGKDFGVAYAKLLHQLQARDANGKPETSGMYDHLFDPYARTETPRPILSGVAGGDQWPETPRDEGMSNFFGKFDSHRES